MLYIHLFVYSSFCSFAHSFVFFIPPLYYLFIQKPQNQSCTQIHIKQNIRKHRTQNIRRFRSFGIALVKKRTYG